MDQVGAVEVDRRGWVLDSFEGRTNGVCIWMGSWERKRGKVLAEQLKGWTAISCNRGSWGRRLGGPGAQLWASEQEVLVDYQQGMPSPQWREGCRLGLEIWEPLHVDCVQVHEIPGEMRGGSPAGLGVNCTDQSCG